MPQETPVKKVSSAKEIKRKSKEITEGKVLEFPSGFYARVKRPPITHLIKIGRIPADLMNATVRQLNGETPNTGKEIQENIKWVDVILEEAFVDPKYKSENPGDNEIGPENLTDEDRGFAINYVQQGVSDLESFRDQIRVVSAGLAGEKISPQQTE